MSLQKAQYKRRIDKPTYEMSARAIEDLRAWNVQEVFSATFLRQFDQLTKGMSGNKIARACWNIRLALVGLREDVEFGEAIDKPFAEILSGFGQGVDSLAFFLDVITAFGVKIDGAPPIPKLRRGVHPHIALARRINKKK